MTAITRHRRVTHINVRLRMNGKKCSMRVSNCGWIRKSLDKNIK